MPEKQDFTVSMTRANVVVLFLTLPLVALQLLVFLLLYEPRRLALTMNFFAFAALVVLGVLVHELVHGLGWMLIGRKPPGAIRLGFQWKTLTPYAHVKEPVEVNAYRIGAFLPGLLLGILPYLLSLVTGDGSLLWFGILHTSAAGGDWLILWLLRGVKSGRLVEDHPSLAGCSVIEPE